MAVRLFVGNLPYTITEAELREHFSTVGQVSGVWLPTDRETGRPRGFGFVEFDDRAVAEEAIRRLNNQPLGGRLLAVNEARPPERGAGPGPRGPGGDAPRPAGPRPGPPPRDRAPAPGGSPEFRRPPRPDRPSDSPPPFGEAGEARRDRPRKPKKRDRSRDFDRVRGPKRPIQTKAGGRFYTDQDDEVEDFDELDELEDEDLVGEGEESDEADEADEADEGTESAEGDREADEPDDK